MIDLLISFVAGVLTVLAPCVLPLLPVVLGGSVSSKERLRPYFIVLGLSISIFIFTLTLKVLALFVGLPTSLWSFISGFILIVFGFFSLFPEVWDSLSLSLNFSTKADKNLHKVQSKKSWYAPFLLGASLGPVFFSCSPTFILLVSTTIGNGSDIFRTVINILAYILGLALILLWIALAGQKITRKFKFASDPKGLFKKFLGVIFILIGLAILYGLDKQFEIWVVEQGLGNFSQNLEEKFKSLVS